MFTKLIAVLIAAVMVFGGAAATGKNLCYNLGRRRTSEWPMTNDTTTQMPLERAAIEKNP